MGFSKEEKSKKVLRGLKTLFFVIAMLISLMLFSATVLLVVADALIPSALLYAGTISSHFDKYDFRRSLIDIPLISIVRSAVIICVYSLCDGPRLSGGVYLGITVVCSVSSVVFVVLKAGFVFGGRRWDRGAVEVGLFVWSVVLAMGHVVVAYRTSCRERRKLLVYKIDIEAVSGFPRYQKILQEERMN